MSQARAGWGGCAARRRGAALPTPRTPVHRGAGRRVSLHLVQKVEANRRAPRERGWSPPGLKKSDSRHRVTAHSQPTGRKTPG